MPNPDHLPFKTIAWNKISLDVPECWQIDSLDAAHMMISRNGAAAVEIKWTDSPRQFNLAAYLKKFIVQSQKRLKIQITELAEPPLFSHPVSHFEFFFFSWTGTASNGTGVLVFCSVCKRLTLIRFFDHSSMVPPSVAGLVLASFADHSVTGQTRWQVFGLTFFCPSAFNLLEYSFKPGCYSIELKDKKTTLTVFSWGPARFLLSQASLAQFAVQQLPQLKGFATAGSCCRGNYLEWSFQKGRFKNADRLPFFSRFTVFRLFRICHDQTDNRILGILVDSPQCFEHDLIKGSMIGDA